MSDLRVILKADMDIANAQLEVIDDLSHQLCYGRSIFLRRTLLFHSQLVFVNCLAT